MIPFIPKTGGKDERLLHPEDRQNPMDFPSGLGFPFQKLLSFQRNGMQKDSQRPGICRI